MINYFGKTLQGHRVVNYSFIHEKLARIGIYIDIFRNHDCDYFLHPRNELFGANILTFLNEDTELVERVLER